MRRVVGAVVLALGTFLLVAAVLLPTYVASTLIRTPLDQYVVSVATAQNATVFNIDTLTVQQNVPVEATRTVRGDVKASTDKVGVLDESLVLENTDTQEQISYSSDRVGLDRRTGESVPGFGASVDETPTRHVGLVYKWPLHAKKKTYKYFDVTTKKPYDARFVGTERIGGIDAYKYRMQIPATRIGNLDVPGELIGSSAPSVKADWYYKNTRTVWIDPTTGTILKGQEEQLQTLRDSSGTDKLTLFEGTLVFDDQTVDEAVDTAKEFGSQIQAVTKIGPIVVGILGLVLLGLGVFLVTRRNDGPAGPTYRPARDDTRTPVGTP